MKDKNNETTSEAKNESSETMGHSENENLSANKFEIEDDAETSEDDDLDADWENRVLCEDGNCIGVIGPNGLCKECGKPYEGNDEINPEDKKEETSGLDKLSIDEDSVTDTGPEETFSHDHGEQLRDDATEQSVADETLVPDDDWESRTLCSDGNCIGVIGPDGRCKECGKPL